MTAPSCGLSPSAKSSAQLLLRALPLAPDLLRGRGAGRGTGGCGRGRRLAAPGAKKWALGSLASPWVSLPSGSSCLPPRTEETPDGKCFILRASSWGGGHWEGGGTRLGRATGHQPEPSRYPLGGHRWGTHPACGSGHPAQCLLSCEPCGGSVPRAPALSHVLKSVQGFR